MIPNNGIYRINSCKNNLGFSGARFLDIFFDIGSNKVFVWYLIDFDSLLWYMWLFCTCYWVIPVPIEVLMLDTQVRFLSLVFRMLWTYMLLCVMSMFDIIFGCLDVYLICSDKKHVVYHISKLALMSCDSAWEAIQVHILTLLYVCDWLPFLAC